MKLQINKFQKGKNYRHPKIDATWGGGEDWGEMGKMEL